MKKTTQRIGIFGGSFDPVHNAHVALARVALAELRLDELIWVPAGQPWQKARTLTPAVHREAMLRLAIEGEPRFILSRVEIERDGPSFTVECPTGSGVQMNLFEVARELARRLTRIFTRDGGARPVYGGTAKFQSDPHWRDPILFYEYFTATTGRDWAPAIRRAGQASWLH